MPETMYLEVEENPNCSYMPMQAYERHEKSVPVSRVRLEEPGRPFGVYLVTGWSSEGGGTPCPAMYAPVSDSGQAAVHLVFGGDWGVRLKPEASREEWDARSEGQFGEPYLMLMDPADVLLDS